MKRFKLAFLALAAIVGVLSAFSGKTKFATTFYTLTSMGTTYLQNPDFAHGTCVSNSNSPFCYYTTTSGSPVTSFPKNSPPSGYGPHLSDEIWVPN